MAQYSGGRDRQISAIKASLIYSEFQSSQGSTEKSYLQKGGRGYAIVNLLKNPDVNLCLMLSM